MNWTVEIRITGQKREEDSFDNLEDALKYIRDKILDFGRLRDDVEYVLGRSNGERKGW